MTEMVLHTDHHPTVTEADEYDIWNLIEVSRVVLKDNGNQTWDESIALITDDIVVAHSKLLNPRHHISPDATRTRDQVYHGFCWDTDGGHIIWFRNTRARTAVVSTLCHEVAHALVSSSVHGHTWRRAYALLLPVWLTALTGRSLGPSSDEVYDEVRRITRTYRRRSNRLVGDIDRETHQHVEASQRSWTRHRGLFIPTVV